MRVVLDECVAPRLGSHLSGHTVQHVTRTPGRGLRNGELLRFLAGQCDAFITVDQNMPYQQNFRNCPFGIVVVYAYRTSVDALIPLVPAIEEALLRVQPGRVIEVGDERLQSRRSGSIPT